MKPKLAPEDFAKISEFITKNFGIKLPATKHVLVESRLYKRLRCCDKEDFQDYTRYLFAPEGRQEREQLIDHISTNKTDFYREKEHFEFLKRHYLETPPKRPLRFWSAACSSGEEPYTLALTMEELREQGVTIDYRILATDISEQILDKARKACYTAADVAPVPPAVRNKYLRELAGTFTLPAYLLQNVAFQRFNLVEPQAYPAIRESFDAIFCRNVLIYFEMEVQQRVVANLISKLRPGGLLFLGHAETMQGRHPSLERLAPTVYRKK